MGKLPALVNCGTLLDMKDTTKLRVARPTNNVDALLQFYGRALGLTILYRFENQDGFDGVMLGQAGAPYHFEFTRAHGHYAGRAPTQDHLLVFYLPDPGEWAAAVEKLQSAGFPRVPAFNAYWDELGATFEDPDGYRVVLQRSD